MFLENMKKVRTNNKDNRCPAEIKRVMMNPTMKDKKSENHLIEDIY
jgi:hypothetical protein